LDKQCYYTKFCFFIFLLFYSFCVKSQEGTVNYKLTINDKSSGQKREQNLIVYFSGSKSIELIIKPQNISTIEKSSDELNQIKVISTKRPYFIYKDFYKRELILSDYVATRKYLISDTLNNFKWKITSEKAKIQNFNCKKATITFRGRFYEVWYTEDIPIRNGPWKFCGLPGLIIKVKDSKSDFVYEMTGIDLKSKFDDRIISLPSAYTNDKAVSYKEFRTLYKKKNEDNLRLSRIEQTTPDGVSGTVKITLPEKQEKF
jgi:GLPGLI family protein